MIIATSQERNLVDCCPCEWPECDAPRKDESLCGFTIAETSPIDTGTPAIDNAKRPSIRWQGTASKSEAYADYESEHDYIYTLDNTIDCGIVINGSGSQSYFSYFDVDKIDIQGTEIRNYTWINNVFSGTQQSIVYDIEGIVISDDTVSFDPSTKPGEFLNFLVISGLAITGLIVTFTGSDNAVSDVGDYAGPQTITYSESGFPYRFRTPDGYTRSTWEMEWDEVSATTAWWAWFDGGMTGAEPTPTPTLVAHRSWVWGGDAGEPWSEWFELPSPDDGYEIRTANVQTVCWKSTRLGVKPTASGDQVAL